MAADLPAPRSSGPVRWIMDSGGGRSDPISVTEEDETFRRNTDCVYFLASPLTCKKGFECEYRHSEGARVNPRDCKFWFSGNCLNPKCFFRHPPLDGLVGNPGASSRPVVAASEVSSSVKLPMANSSTYYNLSKNNVPCYYFQKGACLKGDKCPFKHGPMLASNPVVKLTAKVSANFTTQMETPKKDAWKIKEGINRPNILNALSTCKESTHKPVNGAHSSAKGNTALENANNHLVHSSSSLLLRPRNGLPRSQTTNVPVSNSSSFLQPQNLYVQLDRRYLPERESGEIFVKSSGVDYTKFKGSLNHQVQSSGNCCQNGQEAEVFRESSPGFDILVDRVAKDADYEHGWLQIGSIQGGRYARLGDDYDHHSGNKPTAILDNVQDNEDDELQHYGKVQDHRHFDHPRPCSASKMSLDKSVLLARRSVQKLRSPDEMDASDLRHRLLKHRRLDGSSSATTSGRQYDLHCKHDPEVQDRFYARNSYRDHQHLPESTISSRLRGRITLPKLSSPEVPSDLLDRRDGGRQSVELSTVRPSAHQGRLKERSSRRTFEDSATNARCFGNQWKKGEGVNRLYFTGSRRLTGLKRAEVHGQSTKNVHSTSSELNNSMNSLKQAVFRNSELTDSFEGPKPLRLLLKGKREAGPENNAISAVSIDRKAKAIGDIDVGSCGSGTTPVPEEQSCNTLQSNLEKIKVVSNFEEDDGSIHAADGEIAQAARNDTGVKAATEDEDRNYTDYEMVEGGDYRTEKDDLMEPMDVDLDAEEDEYDFNEKIGLIFS